MTQREVNHRHLGSLSRVRRFLRSARWIKDRDLLTRHNIRALWTQSDPNWTPAALTLDDMTEEDWAAYNVWEAEEFGEPVDMTPFVSKAKYDELLAEREHLLHGICDALDRGTPTESILRALLHGTDHEGHRDA